MSRHTPRADLASEMERMAGYLARAAAQTSGGAVGRSVAGTNLEHARSHNRRVVLDVVRRLGPLSRAEIARETALTQQTISNIVDELELAGFLVPGMPTREGRGQ